MSQEQSAWFRHWIRIPMGASYSIKTDPAAEAPQGPGSMRVSSFRFGFSHTLSPKLGSCMESIVLGKGTTNPSTPTSPRYFRALTKREQERGLAKLMEQQFIMVLQKRGFQQAGTWGKVTLLGMAEPVNGSLMD